MAGGSALPKEKARADLCFSWLRVKDLPLGGTAVLLLLAVSLQAAAVTWLLEASPDIGDVLLKGNPHLKMQLVAASGSYPLLGTSAALVMAQFAFWEGASPSLPCWDQTEAIGAAVTLSAVHRGISGARASARPQPGTASRPGGQGGLPVLRVTLAPLAPARRRSPRVLLYDRRGGGRRRPRGRDPSPGRAPALTGPLASKFKFPPAGGSRGPGPPPRPQPGTASRPGGQGGLPVLRVTLALRAPVRRRSPRALFHDRRGGGRRRPRGRDPPTGRAPALTRPLAAPRPAADDFVGAPKPTSDPPGTARSGRHLELLFTGAAGSSYEGEPPAFHQFVPPDFSTGPRDTGAPCIALSAPLDHGN
ncbi:hypothetical protein NDU88_001604 [Pleurodeles waltl]|uniref:Uncharacterized protein n=1 Tax=Pleurodeles waltl TaxID=8319 RepID=A0AAV7WP39_PLEWA|nr:hypothetical protein NDU88_001604 [Pleurodeles waltl]